MRVLVVADFRRDHPRWLINNSRIFAKGFVRNGHDVLDFSYREVVLSQSPIRSKRWAAWLGKARADSLLVEQVRHFQPELVFVTAFKLLDGGTLAQVREAAPGAKVIFWYGDWWAGARKEVTQFARQSDWFLATSGGEALRAWHEASGARCGFLPNPCDPDVEYPRAVEPEKRTGVVFIGKAAHSGARQDPERLGLLEELAGEGLLTVHGCFGRGAVYGRAYLEALCGADIALSINACNDVELYHSDRLVQCVACGTFTLAKYVPGSERLFRDGEHLRYFRTAAQCRSLIEEYLGDEASRRRIAQAGRERALQEFHCERLADCVVQLAQEGHFDTEWAQFVE